jgi:hypothetical protein
VFVKKRFYQNVVDNPLIYKRKNRTKPGFNIILSYFKEYRPEQMPTVQRPVLHLMQCPLAHIPFAVPNPSPSLPLSSNVISNAGLNFRPIIALRCNSSIYPATTGIGNRLRGAACSSSFPKIS